MASSPELQKPFVQQIFNNTNGSGGEEPLSPNIPIYNVLLIGQSQSGKSTLLEAIKQYANPDYQIDNSRIGNGNVACTNEPRVEDVVTCLPTYKIREASRYGLQEIDLEHYLEETRFDDFKALLNRRDGLEVTAESNSSSFSRFRIIDTPGLDDSEGRDIEILGRIFSVLQSLGHLHLVIITDSHGTTLAPGYQAALRTYSTLFAVMHGLMTFVMTNIPYKSRHPSRRNERLDAKLRERTKIISGIMRKSFPAFKIDCDLQETRPFRLSLTRNTIRDILMTATIKTPVALKLQVRKTPTMKAVDEDVYATYSKFFDGIQASCNILTAADRLRLSIIQKEHEIVQKEEALEQIDTDQLLHLYEVRFAQDWEHFYIIKPTLLQYSTFDYTIGAKSLAYPAVEVLSHLGGDDDDDDAADAETMTMRMEQIDGESIEKFEERGEEEDGSIIDRVCDTHSGVVILERTGGETQKNWSVLFRRKSYERGHYHAILSIKSCNKNRAKINTLKRELSQMREELERLKLERTQGLVALELQGVRPTTTQVEDPTFQSLRDRLSLYGKMKEVTDGWDLGLEVFIELAQSGVYHGGSLRASADALEQFWAAKLGFDPSNHRHSYKATAA